MLTQRQKDILLAIIHDYTKTGLPIGSKALVKQLPYKVSSATIRNEMATLEHLDLLEKTHLSSGRIPSVRGYRYYVKNLISPIEISKTNQNTIQHALDKKHGQIDGIIKQSARILSNLTNYTTIALRPEETYKRTLRGFRLIPLSDHLVIAIMVTDDGEIRNQTFRLSPDITYDQVEPIVELINNQLVGDPLQSIINKLRADIPSQISQYLDTPGGFFDTFSSVLHQVAQSQSYVGGELNLLNFVEQDNPHYIKSMYQLLNHVSDSENISNFLGDNSQPISVRMGSDFNNQLLKHYSLISGAYHVKGYGNGAIAVLGPTRMPYAKIIGIVNAFRKELAKRLQNYYQSQHK